MHSIKKGIYYTLGFSSTTPLLALVLGGHVISLMYLVFVFAFVDVSISRKLSLCIGKRTKVYKYFVYYLLLCIVASLFGAVYFGVDQKEYSLSAISFIPKILIYLSFLILLTIDYDNTTKIKYILIGIKYGALVNIIWSIVDAFLFYTLGFSITNDLFAAVIEAMDLPNTQASNIEGLFIRSAGLTIDQCFIGYYAIALSVYGMVLKKIWIVILSIISCFSSVTFIGFVGIFLVLIYSMLKSKRIVQNLLTLFVFIGFISLILYNTNNEVVSNLNAAVQMRAESKAENDASASTRILFVKEFPGAISNLPTALFLGTGYFSASYAYFQQGLEYGKYNRFHMHPVPIENMYIETLFAVGIIGLLLFVLFYLMVIKLTARLIKSQKGDNSLIILNSFITGAVILFLFYHSVFDSTIMMLSICAAVRLKDKVTIAALNIRS